MPIYLDNAATSCPKPPVVRDAVSQVLANPGGSPGRGSHAAAMDSGRLVLQAREGLAQLFGVADSSRICFFLNATQALNQAVFGLPLSPAELTVVSTTMEHNAVLRPLHRLKEAGATVSLVAGGDDGRVSPEAVLEEAERVGARLIVLSHASNVTGAVQPVSEIGAWCRSRGALLILDASQTAGHLPIDVDTLGVDLLAAPGHKGLLGPQGTGLLYVRPGLELRPLILGGTGSLASSAEMPEQMPDRLEAGTLNVPGLAGLSAAVGWILEQGVETLHRHILQRLRQLREGLAGLPGITLYGPESPADNAGVLSLTVEGEDPAVVGFRLDRDFGISVRVGLHCAAEAHRTIGTYPGGTVRLSPGYATTEAEIEQVIRAFQSLCRF